MSDIHSAFCRFCHAFCAINVEVDNGRIVNIIGDKNNPMYHGYTCIKGSQLASQHYKSREVGPRAVALYFGSFGFPYPAPGPMAAAFMQAINSPMQFSSGRIDQPGKPIATALRGRWNAGPQPFAEADVWMLVGTNPVVSMWGGIPQYNPAKRLHDLDTRSRWRTTQTRV